MTDFYQFDWPVTASGYHWIDSDEGRILTDGISSLAPREHFRYNPMKHTGLFRTFTEVETTEAGIKAFADQYGQLIASRSWPSAASPGLSFTIWELSILKMRAVIGLWQIVRELPTDPETLKFLEQWIRWEGDVLRFGSYLVDMFGSRIHAPSLEFEKPSPNYYIPSTVTALFKPGDLVMPAWYVLQGFINENIKEVSPRLLWGDHGLGLYDVPDSLLTVMWLQLAQAVAGNKHYQRCVMCGSFFEISPSINRRDRIYCSDACRSAAYRKRKEEKAKTTRKRKKA